MTLYKVEQAVKKAEEKCEQQGIPVPFVVDIDVSSIDIDLSNIIFMGYEMHSSTDLAKLQYYRQAFFSRVNEAFRFNSEMRTSMVNRLNSIEKENLLKRVNTYNNAETVEQQNTIHFLDTQYGDVLKVNLIDFDEEQRIELYITEVAGKRVTYIKIKTQGVRGPVSYLKVQTMYHKHTTELHQTGFKHLEYLENTSASKIPVAYYTELEPNINPEVFNPLYNYLASKGYQHELTNAIALIVTTIQ